MNGTSAQAVRPQLPRLPNIGDENVPGARLVRRAASITLGVLSLLLMFVIVVSLFAETTDTVTADGVLEPFLIRDVRAVAGGVITSILVRTGDSVSDGQVVALLDPTEAEARLADVQARAATLASDIRRLATSVMSERRRTVAAVTQAEAGVSRARTNLLQRMTDFGVLGDVDSVARAQSLRTHIGLDGPSSDLLLAKTVLELAVADSSAILLAEADLEQRQIDARLVRQQFVEVRRRLERQRPRAPMSGIVLTEELELLVGSMMSAGQPIMTIGDVSRWRAVLVVGERDIRRVVVGDSATIEIPALAQLAENRFMGRVINVEPQPLGLKAGVSDTRRAGYRIVVAIKPGDVDSSRANIFRRGYAVRGKIVGERGTLIAMALRRLRMHLRRGP